MQDVADSSLNQSLKLSTSQTQTCARARSSSCNRLRDLKRRKLSDVPCNDVIEQEKMDGMRIQYESLVTVLTEVNKAFKELKEKYNAHKNSYDHAIEGLRSDITQKDRELQEARHEIETTKQKLELISQQQTLKPNSSCLSKQMNDTYTKEDMLDVTPSIGNDTIIKELVTPNPTKRMRKKSILKSQDKTLTCDETLDDMKWKEIAQIEKEMLDCYALISGISLVYDYKSALLQPESSSDIGHTDYFECKVESGSKLDGLRFRLALDYESVKFYYQPISDSVSQEKEEMIPSFMKDEISFNPSEAPKLLSRILEKLPQRFDIMQHIAQ